MGIINRAIRNISRRKIRALLVIIALSFSMAILVTIPAGVIANQQTANNITSGLNGAISQTGQSINQTLSQITCTLSSGFSGFGFNGGTTTGGAGQAGRGGFGGFGGGGGSGFFGQAGGGAFGRESTPMNESMYSGLGDISGVAAYEPTLQVPQGGHNETFTRGGYSGTVSVSDYTITGVPLNSELLSNYSILPTNITAGRNLNAGDTGVVLLGESAATYFGATVGQTIQISGQSFQVVGINGASAFSAFGRSDSNVVYMNLSDAQAVTDNQGNVTSFTVYAQNPDLVNQVITSINTQYPELSAVALNGGNNLQTSQTGVANLQQTAADALNQSNSTAIEEIVIVVAATSLIVLFVMLYTVRERTKEIGTLKAIGFSNSTVMGQFLIEGILLSIIAGVVGITIGVLIAPQLAALLVPMNPFGSLANAGAASRITSTVTSPVAISPEIILIAFGAAVVLGALGSLYPAWRAAKIRPAEAMKYE
jgi:putative ABC transport system permease protein